MREAARGARGERVAGNGHRAPFEIEVCQVAPPPSASLAGITEEEASRGYPPAKDKHLDLGRVNDHLTALVLKRSILVRVRDFR